MTAYVNQIIPNSIEFFANEDFGDISTFQTWIRSENTQKWLGPFPILGTTYEHNARFSKWLCDTSSMPGLAEEHRNGYYHLAVTPIPVLVNPTYQQIVKLVFDPGGDTNTQPYISNNEEREADTYFRPNY